MMRRLLSLFASLSLSCSNDETPVAEPPPRQETASWQVVFDGSTLDRAALGVSGRGSEVFVVGGPLGNEGFEPLALRFDGASWVELHPGGTSSFWWVSAPPEGPVWMVGERGRVARFDQGVFEELVSGVDATLFGVWAASATDVWMVGGNPGKGTAADNDVVLHHDGVSLSREALPGPPRGASLFKVWGSGPSDVYVVGEGGTIWHRGAGGWVLEAEAPLVKANLLTVSGCSRGDLFAVGARTVMHGDGASWSPLELTLSGMVNGVSCGASGDVVLVGSGGLKMRREGGRWVDDFEQQPFADLHSAYASADGSFWAVGGDFSSPPAAGRARQGVVARFGKGAVGSALRR